MQLSIAPFTPSLEPDQHRIELAELFELLRRRYRLALICFVLVMLAAGMGLAVTQPAFTASALVLVDPSHKDLLEPLANAANANSDSARIDSEVEIVKSETILSQALRDADLLADPEFAHLRGWREWLATLLSGSEAREPSADQIMRAALSRLDASVFVQRRGMTYVIMVAATAGSPEQAARIANAVAGAYIRSQVSSKVAAVVASRDIINGRTTQANADVIAAEGAFDTFIASHVGDIAEVTGRTDIVDQYAALVQRNDAANRISAKVHQASTRLAIADFTGLAALLQSADVNTLVDRHAALQQRLGLLSAGSPEAQAVQAELAAVQLSLSQSARFDIGHLKAELAAAHTQSSQLRLGLRSSLLDGDLPAGVLTEIYALEQSADIARTQYQKLIARSKDLQNQAYMQVADSRVVSPAMPPVRPSFPNPMLMLGLGLVGAMMSSVAAVLLAENVFGGFTSEEQLRLVLRVRRVASLPACQPLHRPGDTPSPSPADAVVFAPLSMFAESTRKVRLGIDHALPVPQGDGLGAVIMVTSSEPNEGKTTTALALARAYSLANRTALLIDCDLRKPSVHRHLGLARSSGLMDYLVEDGAGMDFSSILMLDPYSKVHIALGAGRSDIATDQLLTAPTFTKLVTLARKSFDIVILDTPPVGPVVDGLYLSRFADAIVFVVQWAGTAQKEVRNALGAIEASKPSVVQVLTVLTQRPQPKTAARKRYAGYYLE